MGSNNNLVSSFRHHHNQAPPQFLPFQSIVDRWHIFIIITIALTIPQRKGPFGATTIAFTPKIVILRSTKTVINSISVISYASRDSFATTSAQTNDTLLDIVKIKFVRTLSSIRWITMIVNKPCLCYTHLTFSVSVAITLALTQRKECSRRSIVTKMLKWDI